MAQDTPLPQSKTDAPRGRDLSSAILACFSADVTTPAFEDRLVELTVALSNQQNVSIWSAPKDDTAPTCLAHARGAKVQEQEADLVAGFFETAGSSQTSVIQPFERYLAASVALPGGQTAAILVEFPASGAMAKSLVYERATLLAHLSFSQFRHGDLVAQSQLIGQLNAVAGGDHAQLHPLTDTLAQLMGAQYAAAGIYARGDLGEIAISGQSGPAKRAQLPATLREKMADIVAKRVSGWDRLFATPDGANGLALIVEKPTRNHGMLQLAGGVYRQAQHAKPASKWTLGRFVKLAAFGLISVGILLIPIPDGVELSAQVEAAQKRVITAPLSTTIAEVLVKDRAPVVGGKTPLLRLDANEIKIDLIGVQAERAAAILERETARASRNPALLRNAELEVQRLESRLALLELQRDSSTVIAPISGIAILPELQQKLGSTVRQGEVLMEVIDPSALRLSLAILESRISKVEEGTAGIFRPDFDPTLRVAARLTTISPALDNTQDIPVIQARADFEDATDTLRPGLSGIFSVGAEYRPIGEVLYRAIRNWVLLRLWI